MTERKGKRKKNVIEKEDEDRKYERINGEKGRKTRRREKEGITKKKNFEFDRNTKIKHGKKIIHII